MVDGAGGLDEFLGPRRRGTIELAGRVRVRAKQVAYYACHGQPAVPKLRRCQVTRPSVRVKFGLAGPRADINAVVVRPHSRGLVEMSHEPVHRTPGLLIEEPAEALPA